MDLAITYRCNDDCARCYNARLRNYPECSTDRWKTVLDRLWEAGIPHIVFTGGEPTLREDLPELVAHAGKNGQITGMNTNARRLHDANYLGQLVDPAWITCKLRLDRTIPVFTIAWCAPKALSRPSLACAMHWIHRCT